MFLKYTVVFACLGFISLSGAYKITPNVVDGISEALNITTEPFVKIGKGYYYIVSNAKKNWYEAYESCRGMGAALISFETMEEWDLVREFMWELELNGVFWTAGNDLGNQGKHVWHSTGEPLALDIWSPGEPNNQGGVEHCDDVFYLRTRAINLLNDRNCLNTSRYICEAAELKTTS